MQNLPSTLICTVGTSLFFPNLIRLDPESQYQTEHNGSVPTIQAEKKALQDYGLWTDRKRLKEILTNIKQSYEEKNWGRLAGHLVLLPPALRLCGAEINSIEAMIRKGFLSEKRSHLVLLTSDTEDGSAIGSILSSYFADPKCRIGFGKCEYLTVRGLQDERPLVFQREGLANLVRHMGELLRKWGRDSVAINATGGYKAQIALAVAFGQVAHCPVFYKHERFDQIIRFPEVPFTFDLSLVENHLKLWETLTKPGALFEEKEVDRLLLSTPELKNSIYPMLDRIEEEENVLFTLSPLGMIFWEAYLSLNQISKKRRIFQLSEYQEINENYFTKGMYVEALPRYRQLYDKLHSNLTSADKAILLNRIANCASDSILTECVDDLSLVEIFWDYLDKYLRIAPEGLREDQRLRGAIDEPKKRLNEALELLILFDIDRLKEKAVYWVRRFSTIDAPGWGYDLALGVLMEKINDERIQFTRADHIANTRALAEVYIEVSEPVAQTYRYARATAMNILSDLAYFQGGEKGEEEALLWARRCLEINPDDLFAKTRKKYIEERQTVEEQIRRFKHDTSNTIAGIREMLEELLLLPQVLQNGMYRNLKAIQVEVQHLYGAHRFMHDEIAIYKSIDPDKEIKDMIMPYDEISAHFTLTSSGSKKKWVTDPDYFRLAMYNLIKNSLEAFERRRIPLLKRQIRISVLFAQQTLTIEDNAGGVDSIMKDRIFSPYVSSKGIKKKTGLGLSNARMAIEKVNGTLDFPEKQPQDGARFKICLLEKE